VRKLILLLMAPVILVAFLALPAGADTGTYRILDYQVTLTPHSDGKVDIDYYQKWLVTGGHIPWITVGLPNDDYEITKSGLNVAAVKPANEGGWSGVRLDLDKDYQPNQTFRISFSISQSRLFYADADNYRLDFTPGWYDRAVIDSLAVRLKSFAKTESLTADPTPTSVSDEELAWAKNNLAAGEHFSVAITFPKAIIPNPLPEDSLKSGETQGQSDTGESADSGCGAVGTFFVIVIIIIIIISRFGRSGYSGGSIFTSGGIGGGGSDSHPRSTGGGGGFGGSGFSCACACVSCACACACAGGGGAGCSRKLRHTCPACREKKQKLEENN
jgi:hypothetical protein